MKFTKMHGLGNDYLYVFSESLPQNAPDLSVKYSDRHFGVGSDGIIWILPSAVADYKMRIFNADGSEAAMCGNGIRCVGKYVFDNKYTDKTQITVETLSGVRELTLHIKDGSVESVTVDMGKGKSFEEKQEEVNGKAVTYTPVNVGNNHAVIFTDITDTDTVNTVGKLMQSSENFPDGVNVEFVSTVSSRKIRMRVFERGSGITNACGTGACASAFAAVGKGVCPQNEEIEVVLDGGSLFITILGDDSIVMRGPAATVFTGEIPND